ncbi:MAG: hypothetical protein LBC18_09750, partial [Opitutaceae bacterium]|nr:hypothetical protein [Opitutaceae bacterium]
ARPFKYHHPPPLFPLYLYRSSFLFSPVWDSTGKLFHGEAPLKIHFEQKETKETKIKNKENPGLTVGLKLFTKKRIGINNSKPPRCCYSFPLPPSVQFLKIPCYLLMLRGGQFWQGGLAETALPKDCQKTGCRVTSVMLLMLRISVVPQVSKPA